MKYKYLLKLYFLLFFVPSNSFANDFDISYLHCNQVPEGNPFGLIFDNSKVSQIGIENFKKIYDYSESYTKLNQEIKWLNVALNLEKLTLHIGNQSNYFAKCEKINNLKELNKLLENFIISLQYKNTI